MASSSTSPQTHTKLLPRDAAVMHAILKEMGIKLYEPRVINQMLEYVYRYVTGVVEEARVYSQYAKKKTVDLDDIKLATKLLTEKSLTSVPPRDLLLDLAKTKNVQPLPLIKSSSGLRLPPDRYCLTQPNYQLQMQRKAIASSSSKPQSINVKLPGSSGGFKAPLGLPPRSVVSSSLGPGGAALSSPAASSQPTIQYAANIQLGGTGTPTITVLANPAQGSGGTKRKFSETEDQGAGN